MDRTSATLSAGLGNAGDPFWALGAFCRCRPSDGLSAGAPEGSSRLTSTTALSATCSALFPVPSASVQDAVAFRYLPLSPVTGVQPADAVPLMSVYVPADVSELDHCHVRSRYAAVRVGETGRDLHAHLRRGRRQGNRSQPVPFPGRTSATEARNTARQPQPWPSPVHALRFFPNPGERWPCIVVPLVHESVHLHAVIGGSRKRHVISGESYIRSDKLPWSVFPGPCIPLAVITVGLRNRSSA